MFRCLSVRVRNFPSALLLSTSLAFSVDALADPGDYRVRDETRSNGLRVVQQVDAITFPQFQGSRPPSSGPDAPGIEAGNLRAVRVLMPKKGNSSVAIASQDGATRIVVDFYNHHVVVGYHGPSISESTNPFLGTDRSTTWQSGERRWQQIVPIGRKISANATHFVVTLYVVPRLNNESMPQGKSNLLVTVKEATVQGMHVVGGRLLAGNVTLAVDERNWSHWRQEPLRAGVVSANDSPLDPARAITRRLPFVEQRTIDLRDESGGRRRDKRCVSDILYQASNLLLPALLEVYFGQADLCSLDPHPNQDIAGMLPLVEVTDPQDIPRNIDSTVFEASALNPDQDTFDAAMGIQFCNANHRPGDGEEPCSDDDQRAIAAIGDLTPLEIDELLAQITRMFDPDQPGTGTLRTGIPELDRWLNANPARAEEALNAAKAIVHVSDAAKEPKAPVKNKKKKKAKLLKASCISTTQENDGSGDAFELCVRKATRKIGETGPVVALPPLVENNERFHLRGTPEFNRLVREFRNTGRSLPPGIADEQFSRFTAAIARDRAPTGDNLGIIFINDPALRGNDARFKYGIEHIWSPGGGGGDDEGHREDWQGLPGLSVNGREMLAQVIMAALTDPNARFTQTRSRNGNIRRNFEYFTFMRGQQLFVIRNVRIVLGQNGMVITAFPLPGAGAESLEM